MMEDYDLRRRRSGSKRNREATVAYKQRTRAHCEREQAPFSKTIKNSIRFEIRFQTQSFRVFRLENDLGFQFSDEPLRVHQSLSQSLSLARKIATTSAT